MAVAVAVAVAVSVMFIYVFWYSPLSGKFRVRLESAKGTPLADLVDWHGFPFSETLRHYLDRELWKLRLRSVTDDF